MEILGNIWKLAYMFVGGLAALLVAYVVGVFVFVFIRVKLREAWTAHILGPYYMQHAFSGKPRGGVLHRLQAEAKLRACSSWLAAHKKTKPEA